MLSDLTLFDEYDTGTHGYMTALADVVNPALLRAYHEGPLHLSVIALSSIFLGMLPTNGVLNGIAFFSDDL